MNLHPVSDLHIAKGEIVEPLPLCADVLVLAGDVIEGASNVQAIAAAAKNYIEACRPVLFVAGNHEFFGSIYAQAIRSLHRECAKLGITFLHNRALTIEGVDFFGATLWTSFVLPGMSDKRGNISTGAHFMPEYRMCWTDKRGGQPLSPDYTIRAHNKSRRLLEKFLFLKSNRPKCVITHHAPSLQGVAPRYRGSTTTAAFVTNMEPMIAQHGPHVWVFGHTHFHVDKMLMRTRLFSNPRGYTSQREDFKPSKTVRI